MGKMAFKTSNLKQDAKLISIVKKRTKSAPSINPRKQHYKLEGVQLAVCPKKAGQLSRVDQLPHVWWQIFMRKIFHPIPLIVFTSFTFHKTPTSKKVSLDISDLLS